MNQITGQPAGGRRRERGATAIEYALLLSLIAAVAIPAIAFVGRENVSEFETLAAGIETTVASEDDAAGSGSETGEEESEEPDDGDGNGNGSGNGNGNGNGSGSGTGSGQGTGEDEPEIPGSTVEAASSSSEFYWWNNTSTGGEGAWKGSVTYDNDWVRHQYLDLEVTRHHADGTITTETVEDFYVPAGGASTFTSWNNQLTVNRGGQVKGGVEAIEVTVTSIRTSDESWAESTHPTTGPTTTVPAPPPGDYR